MKGLFLEFSKIKEDRSMNKEGCGLGLIVCKRLAVVLGGDVAVISERGKGSTFSVTIKDNEK